MPEYTVLVDGERRVMNLVSETEHDTMQATLNARLGEAEGKLETAEKVVTEYRQKWSDEASKRSCLEQEIRSYLQELVGDGALTLDDANTWLNDHRIESLVSEWTAAINVTIHVTLESGLGEDDIEDALHESLSVEADFFGSGLENVIVDDVDFESVDVSRA